MQAVTVSCNHIPQMMWLASWKTERKVISVTWLHFLDSIPLSLFFNLICVSHDVSALFCRHLRVIKIHTLNHHIK